MTTDRLDSLLDALLESDPTADQLRELQSLVQSDPQAMARYLDTLELHAALAWKNRQGVQGSGFRVQERKSAIRNPQFAIGLAALIALALTVWFLLPRNSSTPQSAIRNPQSNPVAMLSDLSPDAAFAPGSYQPMQPGADLPPGPIRLTAGRAQIMFKSTAVVDLTGPCEFEMTGLNQGMLTAGALKAFVPERARGLAITLPGGVRIIDLGTRFTAVSTASGGSMVHVHEGRVRVEDAQRTQTLAAGQSLWLNGQDWLAGTEAIDRPLEGVQVAGDVRTIQTPAQPILLLLDLIKPGAWVYQETDVVRLPEDLTVSLAPAASKTYTVGNIQNSQAVISAGTAVRCYMIAYKAASDAKGVQQCAGSIRFQAPILGVITTQAHMRSSGEALNLGVSDALWEAGATPFDGSDVLSFTDRQHQLKFTCRAQAGGTDFLRVIVAAAPDSVQTGNISPLKGASE